MREIDRLHIDPDRYKKGDLERAQAENRPKEGLSYSQRALIGSIVAGISAATACMPSIERKGDTEKQVSEAVEGLGKGAGKVVKGLGKSAFEFAKTVAKPGIDAYREHEAKEAAFWARWKAKWEQEDKSAGVYDILEGNEPWHTGKNRLVINFKLPAYDAAKEGEQWTQWITKPEIGPADLVPHFPYLSPEEEALTGITNADPRAREAKKKIFFEALAADKLKEKNPVDEDGKKKDKEIPLTSAEIRGLWVKAELGVSNLPKLANEQEGEERKKFGIPLNWGKPERDIDIGIRYADGTVNVYTNTTSSAVSSHDLKFPDIDITHYEENLLKTKFGKNFQGELMRSAIRFKVTPGTEGMEMQVFFVRTEMKDQLEK
jgi:hypothetical protein